MFVVAMKTTRTRLAVWGIGLMALLATVLVAAGQPKAVATTAAGNAAGRAALLESLGYDVTPQWTGVREVAIPAQFDQRWVAYNDLQKAAGYDLTPYQGERVKCYTYAVQMGDTPATATLYVAEGQVIAGDIAAGDKQWGLVTLKQGETNGATG